MKVFISSVRRGLESERDYLPEFITAIGHAPLRFEDFPAQNLTSRGACLTGVQDADVYLLLLGPNYGMEMDDSGISATEEEFNTATTRGIPIYVFKKRGITPEPAQQTFMDTVGRYHEGRFWKEFSDNAELGTVVASALRDHQPAAPDFIQMPLDRPLAPMWRRERPPLQAPRDGFAILEAHVLPVEAAPLRPVAGLGDLATRLATDARHQGFFGHGDALGIDADSDGAWVIRQTPDDRRNRGWGEASTDTFAGIHVSRDGNLTIFQALRRDTMGTLVDQADLTQRLTVLLRHLVNYLPQTQHVSLAAAIDPATHVSIGDPTTVGGRNQGTFGMNRNDQVQAPPTDQIATDALAPHLTDAATDLAVRLMNELRRR